MILWKNWSAFRKNELKDSGWKDWDSTEDSLKEITYMFDKDQEIK
jgi:hypothetical protein